MHDRMMFVGACCAVLAVGPAYADDGTAALAAGGIVMTKGTPIRMKVEDLYISPDLVRVRFEFANDTGQSIDTLVAFPLPDVVPDCTAGMVGAMTNDPVNFVGFKAQANGKQIGFKVEHRAIIKGRDVTTLLKATGAPINTYVGNGCNKLAALPRDTRKRLIAAGVVEDRSAGDDNWLEPLWDVHTKFYWTQRFPAHRSVVIEHSYKPVTGAAYLTTDGYISDRAKYPTGVPWQDKVTDEFCHDAAAEARLLAVAKNFKKTRPTKSDFINVYTTDYILSTARNWNGPIGRFRMTLDKLQPGNVLSLCWDGTFKKSGPATFTFTATDYVPRRDVHMVVYTPAAAGMPSERPR